MFYYPREIRDKMLRIFDQISKNDALGFINYADKSFEFSLCFKRVEINLDKTEISLYNRSFILNPKSLGIFMFFHITKYKYLK